MMWVQVPPSGPFRLQLTSGAAMLALPADFAELVTFDAGSGAVVSREGKRLEFKEGFIAADLSDYTKVLASFANALYYGDSA